MLSKILPMNVLDAIDGLSIKKLNEIRVRLGKPYSVMYEGKSYYLSHYGLTLSPNDSIVAKDSDIDYILSKASDNSLYAVNDQLISGFLTIRGGIRIGVCGELVREKDKIVTIKNITSLNIRIPHAVKNCSLEAYNFIVHNGKCSSTLIISPPGAGKTTFIRDLVTQICLHERGLNILIADERCEIAGYTDREDTIGLGDMCDVYLNTTKAYAFDCGIRSMKPDIIVCDEINLDQDVECIKEAMTCGVKVIATIHANDINDLRFKPKFREIINNSMFDRYIVLSSRCGVGTLERIYDKNFATLYASGK